MVVDTDLAWLAGILDGEGTIHLGRGNYCVKRNGRTWRYQCIRYVVIISNTDPSIILECQRIMNAISGGAVNRLKYARVPKGYSPQYLLRITSCSGIKKFLTALMPYLVGKKPQAELLMAYLTQRESKWKIDKSDFSFTDSMYALNRKRSDRFLPIVETSTSPTRKSEDTARADGQPSEVSGNDLPASQ